MAWAPINMDEAEFAFPGTLKLREDSFQIAMPSWSQQVFEPQDPKNREKDS